MKLYLTWLAAMSAVALATQLTALRQKFVPGKCACDATVSESFDGRRWAPLASAHVDADDSGVIARDWDVMAGSRRFRFRVEAAASAGVK